MRYVAYLARSISARSISQYLNVIRIIHLELGYPNPLINNHMLETVLRGVSRVKGLPQNKKLPISPSILLGIRSQLNFSQLLDVMFWATCLLLFFTWLRKSNVLPVSSRNSGGNKIICRGDFVMSSSAPQLGLFVNIAASKTIQFQERVLTCPLPFLPGHPLCPVTAIIQAFRSSPQADPSCPAFSWRNGSNQLVTLTYQAFQGKLRQHLALCGLDPSKYASHSFRRGGCSWGLRQGLNLEMLQLLRDWKSQCVKEYMSVPLIDKISAMQQFAKSLPTT